VTGKQTSSFEHRSDFGGRGGGEPAVHDWSLAHSVFPSWMQGKCPA